MAALLLGLFKKIQSEYNCKKLLELSCHWNGYKREDAVKQLGELGNINVLPALIERVNDWVPQVRKAAREAIVKLAIPDNAEVFIKYLPKLFHLRKCSRDYHGDFIEDIVSRIMNEENSAYIINGINNSSRAVSHICMSWIINSKLMSHGEIINNYLNHPDEMIRTKVAGLIKYLDKNEQAPVMEVAINDDLIFVRREVLNLSIENGDNAFIEKFLFDRHSSLREKAVYYLNDLGLDLNQIYSESLNSNSPFRRCCAIWGIAELKCTEFIPQLERLLKDQYSCIRKQAIYSLSKLLGEDAKSYLVDAISDKSPSTSKEAGKWLNRLGIRFSASELLDIVNGTESAYSITSCIAIAALCNKWERLIFLLNLLDEKYSSRLSKEEQILSAIRSWNQAFNKVSSTPTSGQIQELGLKVNQYKEELVSEGLEELIFSMKSYGAELF